MSFRNVLTVLVLVVVSGVFVWQIRKTLADPTIWPPDDFVEYWAAAKLTLAGENPYDPNQLLPLQRLNGRQTDEAVMMWNPPWTLPVVLPLGLVPAREAQLLWLAVNFAAILFCGDRLWLLLGGARDRRWVGWACVLAAMPTLFALQAGQIGPLLLLGAVLFLECERRGWHRAAGAATILLAIKPHLAYLVWVAILLDAVGRGRWRIVLGGAAAGLVCAVLPLTLNSHVWGQYADAMAHRPPSQWVSPTIGSLLRLAFGEHLFGFQFLPVAVGLVWFTWYWRKTGRDWNWGDQLPLLLLVSFVTAPYGAWPFDMVLLLPAVVYLIAARERESVACQVGGSMLWKVVFAGLVAVNIGCLVLNVLRFSSLWFLWVSPVVLVLYIVGTRRRIPAHRASGAPISRNAEAVPA